MDGQVMGQSTLAHSFGNFGIPSHMIPKSAALGRILLDRFTQTIDDQF